MLLLAAACGRRAPEVVLPPPIPARPGFTETGVASWYGHPYHGRRTSNGEVYDMDEMTAAHLRLPFGTILRVRNLDNDRTVEVRINDRGPFVKSRILDLSREAARRLHMIGPGTARVRLEVVAGPAEVSRSSGSTPSDAPEARACLAVQLGAFSSSSNAAALQDRIALAWRPDVQIIEVVRNGAALHRVVSTPDSNAAAVRRDLESLSKAGFEGFISEVSPPTGLDSRCE